jgi:hypothetical protein
MMKKTVLSRAGASLAIIFLLALSCASNAAADNSNNAIDIKTISAKELQEPYVV